MKNTIVIVASCIIACAALYIFCVTGIDITSDTTANGLINDCLGRGFAAIAIIVIVCACGERRVFTDRSNIALKSLLWCLPCLLVVVANFPFSALISGSASVQRTDLLWLFILDCLLIACMEEVLFRGILLNLIIDIFKDKILLAVIAESSVFALCHLFNLLSGANPAATLLQVGYTFLTGMMFSFVFIKTKNVWTGIFLHTLFDIGGNLVTTLGGGSFHDVIFWILTIVFAVLCAGHIAASYFLKKIN